MGLTKRKDGWYVEFPVIDDGKVLTLARGTPGSNLKRWKTLTPNKTMATQQEAMIKTDLMKGRVKSERESSYMTFQSLARIYHSTQTVQKHKTYP
jgi:hypothetical protein